MNGARTLRARWKVITILGGLLGLVVAGLLMLVAARLLSGHGLGLRSAISNRLHSFTSVVRAVADSPNVAGYSHGDFTDIIFLHHSTGHNLIEQGGVREAFTRAGYSFWDHDYNPEGLRRPDGSYAGYSYNIPDDNTDPDGLARIFAQRAYSLPLNAFSGLLQHEVIVSKSCFPASNITSEEQLTRYKSYYLAMRDVMDRHRDRILIVMSPPPLNPAEATPEAAARARAFAEWLKSDAFVRGHPNVFVFDFFGSLAEEDPASPDYNMLRSSYREGTDSHPNEMANRTAGPVFVGFIEEVITGYRAFLSGS